MSQDSAAGSDKDDWTTSTREEFYDYYAEQSNAESTRQRFRSQKDRILKFHGENVPGWSLDVGDIGGGAGSLSMIWAEDGHRVRCVDINAHLIELARKRSVERRLDITFEVASATDLPWQDQSLDVCCLPELLERVEDWKCCLDEMARVLRPGDILFLSTSNKLCPKSLEFALPLYSWCPGRL
jgi:2-polyprenyl-6-hydroxyphenyl methylase/3-demethylubiquinone-9 3-methyltransferase